MTDDDFVRLWMELKSPEEMSKKMGIHVRNVYARRSKIELKLGIALLAERRRPNAVRNEIYTGRINIEIKDGSVIVFSDAHYWPDKISTAHRALVQTVDNLEPAAVICNGDAFDGSQISRFPRVDWSHTPTVKEELDTVTERLEEIEKVAKNAALIWCLGNHDARFETKIVSALPEFIGIEGTSLKDFFPRWMPAWSCWVNSDTVIKHRWKGGIHATHNNTVNSGVNFVTGHLHSQKISPFTDFNGIRYGVDTGCVAAIYGDQFNYVEDNPRNWRSGFAVLTFHDGKLLPPEVLTVIDEHAGTVTFRGKVWTV